MTTDNRKLEDAERMAVRILKANGGRMYPRDLVHVARRAASVQRAVRARLRKDAAFA